MEKKFLKIILAFWPSFFLNVLFHIQKFLPKPTFYPSVPLTSTIKEM